MEMTITLGSGSTVDTGDVLYLLGDAGTPIRSEDGSSYASTSSVNGNFSEHSIFIYFKKSAAGSRRVLDEVFDFKRL